jgi:hypothetical protein
MKCTELISWHHAVNVDYEDFLQFLLPKPPIDLVYGLEQCALKQRVDETHRCSNAFPNTLDAMPPSLRYK